MEMIPVESFGIRFPICIS